MTDRTISISEEFYGILQKLKLPGENLEDTILRLSGLRSRGADFEKALDKVLTEDAELLERLAQ